MKKISSCYYIFFLFISNFSCYCYSNTKIISIYNHFDTHEESNISTGALNISKTLLDVINLVLSVTTLAGVIFLFAAVAKFYQHRKNPQQVPISQSLVLILLGIILIILPYILIYGDSAYNIVTSVL